MASYLWSVEQAYRMAGVLTGPRRGLSPSEQTEGRFIANAMLDSWEVERLMAYVIDRNEFVLTPSQYEYTIGPAGANFTLTVPARLERAGVIPLGDDTEDPIAVLTEEQWANTPMKTETAEEPDGVYYELGNPLGLVRVHPIPTEAATLVLYTWQQLRQIDEVINEALFPKGYQAAFEYQLALAVHDRYPESPMSARVESEARRLKGLLKNLNTPRLEILPGPEFLEVDAQRGWYDAYTNRYE